MLLRAPVRRAWEPARLAAGALQRAGTATAAATPAAPPPAPPPRAPPPPAGPVVSLRAFPRPAGAGKNAPRRARRAGLIPGVVYGPGVAPGSEARVVVAADALRAELHRRRDGFLCTTVDLALGDATVRVLPRDLQLHPFRPKVIACNWLALAPGRYPGVRLDVPLRPVNEERCPAYREGGWLLELVHKLPVYVFGDDVPPFFAMDLRGKRVGDKVMASEINLGDGVHLRSKVTHDFAVAKLVGTRRADPVAAPAAAAGADKKAAAKPAAAGGAGAPAAGAAKK